MRLKLVRFGRPLTEGEDGSRVGDERAHAVRTLPALTRGPDPGPDYYAHAYEERDIRQYTGRKDL